MAEDTIREHWHIGRQHLQSAIDLLACFPRSTSGDEAITLLRRGKLPRALGWLSEYRDGDRVRHHLKAAEDARVRVVAVAQSAYFETIEMFADRHGALDPSDLISQTWFKAYDGALAWLGKGNFKSWLLAISRHELATQRRRPRFETNTESRVFDQEVHMPLAEKGTWTLGQEAALESYLASLDPARRYIWDEWCRRVSSGHTNESIYQCIAAQTSQTHHGVKSTILRIKEECQRIMGKDPSGVVVLDIGVVRAGDGRSVITTGLDLDDRRRLYMIHPLGSGGSRMPVRVLEILKNCGLANDRRILVVVSGDPRLREAVELTLGARAEVQVCLNYVERQVLEAIPKATRRKCRRSIRRAIGLRSIEDARSRLFTLCDEAKVPRSWVEPWLTFKRLRIDHALRQELCRTRFSSGLEAVFEKLRGHRSLPRRRDKLVQLSEALNA